MPRYSSGTRTGAGSTTLPIISIYAAAAATGRLREVGVFNTTDTEFSIRLIRLTTAGTQGAGLAESPYDVDSNAAGCTVFTTHSGAPTLGADLGYRADIGAAKGSGVIWTFGVDGIRIPIGVTNGIGVLIAVGSGQAADSYLVWDE
jgi:hypothetical protein